jgi:hypothetical protein
MLKHEIVDSSTAEAGKGLALTPGRVSRKDGSSDAPEELLKDPV